MFRNSYMKLSASTFYLVQQFSRSNFGSPEASARLKGAVLCTCVRSQQGRRGALDPISCGMHHVIRLLFTLALINNNVFERRVDEGSPFLLLRTSKY